MRHPSPASNDRLFRYVVAHPERVQAQMGERRAALHAYHIDRVSRPSLRAANRQLVRWSGRRIPPDQLRKVTVPVSLIWGRNERIMCFRIARPLDSAKPPVTDLVVERMGGGIMYRYRLRQQVLYGHFQEFMELAQELNTLARSRGWKEASLWVPTVGTTNEVIVEIEYPDLATFEQEQDAFYSDPDAMKLVLGLATHVAQGSVQDELLKPAPSPA